MRYLAMLLTALVLLGCPPAQQKQKDAAPKELTSNDFIRQMRENKIHNIRRESNRNLTEKTRVKAAYDIYVNQQQVMLLELRPNQEPANFRPFFDGYLKQGYKFYTNANLIMVAREGIQKEILESFENL